MLFKYRRLSVVVLVVALLGFGFQNCGPQQMQSTQYSLGKSTVEIGPPKESDPPSPPAEKARTSFEPILADRYYVDSLFTDIFGPTYRGADSTGIYRNASDFGAPCSLYAAHLKPDGVNWVSADVMELCGRGTPAFNTALVLPKSSVTRQAKLTRACSDLSLNPATSLYAIRRVKGGDGLPDPTPENLTRLFHLFYRDKPEPSPEVLQSLMVLFPDTEFTAFHWSLAIYTVCASGLWQVL